jgi:AcrR family transcriptional regulator
MSSTIKQQQKEFVRNAIIAAAEKLVLDEGWQKVSIRKLAEAIGYSLPVVYNHFESKEALHREFVAKGFAMLTEEIKACATPAPQERLVQIALSYFKFAFDNEAYYKLMFGLGIPSCDKAKEIPEIAAFSEIIKLTIKPLIIEEDENRLWLKFHSFWSILHGLTSINMVSATAAPNHLQEKILLDIVQGFTININH